MIQDKGENGKLQYFWETFPVGIGRNGVEETDVKTTYMFTVSLLDCVWWSH
jgi:hypothetical protein